MAAIPRRNYLSSAEAQEVLKALSPDELNDIARAARYYAGSLPGNDPDRWRDIFHEAYARVLDARRRIPADVPLVAVLVGIMRSLRDEFLTKHLRSWSDVSRADPEEQEARLKLGEEFLEALKFLDPRKLRSIISEGIIASSLLQTDITRIVSFADAVVRFMAHFEDLDERIVVGAMMLGLTREEMAERLTPGLNVDSVVRRVQRKVEKVLPGWRDADAAVDRPLPNWNRK